MINPKNPPLMETVSEIDREIAKCDKMLGTIVEMRTKARMHAPPLWNYDVASSGGARRTANLDLKPVVDQLEAPFNFRPYLQTLGAMARQLRPPTDLR